MDTVISTQTVASGMYFPEEKMRFPVRDIPFDIVKLEPSTPGSLRDRPYAIYTGEYLLGGRYLTQHDATVNSETDMKQLVEFWNSLLRGDRSNCWVVNGYHYMVGDTLKRGAQGHGGRRFVIYPLNGAAPIVTRNLWSQGFVPRWLQDALPDTASFTPTGKVN